MNAACIGPKYCREEVHYFFWTEGIIEYCFVPPPRKMVGVVSEGMLFDIGYPDGITPVLAVPESRVPDGTRAG